MRRFLIAAGVFALVAGVTAQDPKPDPKPADPAQPVPRAKAAILPAQPALGRPAVVTAAKMATLEEEFETLEAHRDVRKAYVKAAEVAVKAAELGADRVRSLVSKNVATREDMDKAQLELEAARAQLEIRIAEVKEVEVKIKFAKKRLDDAKAAGVRPPVAPRVDPKPVDPPPPQ